MILRAYLLWFLCWGCQAAVQNITDPCKSFSLLDGKPRQKQLVTNVNHATPICDDFLTAGWYRFSDDAGIAAMSKVNMSHCGTVSPVWMDDTLPPPGSIVKKKFCFNNQDLTPNGCMWSMQSPVKNCGGFIVYKLPITPTLCPSALCTDPTIKPCLSGQTSPSGFMPCTSQAAAQSSPDPCKTFSVIDGKPRQKQLTTDVNHATPICDESLTAGWYRFTDEAGIVAMSKVSKLHCGTVSTIWMDDTLPPPGSIVKKKFCFNNQDLTPNGCMWSMQSPVKNCGGFMVYQLPIPSTLCPMAMCTDPAIKPCPSGQNSTSGFMPCQGIPCPPGKWSPSGYVPCEDPYPEISNVILSGPVELAPGDYKHVCLVTSSDTSPDAMFDVKWYMDGVIVSEEVLTAKQRKAFFDLSGWQGHINQELACSVQSYLQNHRNHTSKVLLSNSYYGGIKIEPSPIHLSEGTDMTVDVVSTLPFICKNPTQQPCQLNLNILSPNVYTVDSCNLKLISSGNSSTHESSAQFEIASLVDMAVKSDINTFLEVEVAYNDSVNGLGIWTNASRVKIEVTVTDSKHTTCAATGDPHFVQSFSHKGTYNLYHQGDFYFASDARVPIAVQIETNTLYQPTHLPMISAVAIQTGSDVTIIDTEGGTKMASVTARHPPTSHTVQICGTSEYQISTPSGHRLNIFFVKYNRGTFLNVYAYFPSGIISLTNYSSNNSNTYHELCDVTPTTDGQKSFGRSVEISSNIIKLFRVEPSENLFDGKTLTMPGLKPPTVRYCSCKRDSPGQPLHAQCSSGMKVDDPMVKRASCKVINPAIITAPPSLPRPGAGNFDRQPILPRLWPTHSGITENQARARCRQDIIKFAPNQCVKIKGLGIDEDVDSCAEDVKASDSFDYNAAAVQSFKAKCEHAILSHPSNFNITSHTIPDIVSKQCPNLCSMHGACVNGVCRCEAGWEWKDCSVKSQEPFLITGIQGGILCDKSISNECFKPVLNVDNLGNITHCSVNSTAYVLGRPKNAEAHFKGVHDRESSYSVSCNFASQVTQTDFTAKSFRIQIVPESGTQTSKYIDYVVYDGVCQECLADLTCFLKQDACLIDDKCYKAKEWKILDTRFECDPKVNMNGWTIKPEYVGSGPIGGK